MNLTPKQDFQRTPYSKTHLDLCGNAGFHDALKCSLNELQLSYQDEDPAASWHRLQGAKQFIHILLNLSEPISVPKKTIRGENLIA